MKVFLFIAGSCQNARFVIWYQISANNAVIISVSQDLAQETCEPESYYIPVFMGYDFAKLQKPDLWDCIIQMLKTNISNMNWKMISTVYYYSWPNKWHAVVHSNNEGLRTCRKQQSIQATVLHLTLDTKLLLNYHKHKGFIRCWYCTCRYMPLWPTQFCSMGVWIGKSTAPVSISS